MWASYTPITFVDYITRKIKYTPKEIYVYFEMCMCDDPDKFHQVVIYPMVMMYKKDDKFIFVSNEELYNITDNACTISYKISKTRPFIEGDKRLWFLKITTKKETYKGYEYCPNSVYISKNEKITKMVRDSAGLDF